MELAEDLRSSVRARAKTTSILDTRSSFCEREHCEDEAEVTALLGGGRGEGDCVRGRGREKIARVSVGNSSLRAVEFFRD